MHVILTPLRGMVITNTIQVKSSDPLHVLVDYLRPVVGGRYDDQHSVRLLYCGRVISNINHYQETFADIFGESECSKEDYVVKIYHDTLCGLDLQLHTKDTYRLHKHSAKEVFRWSRSPVQQALQSAKLSSPQEIYTISGGDWNHVHDIHVDDDTTMVTSIETGGNRNIEQYLLDYWELQINTYMSDKNDHRIPLSVLRRIMKEIREIYESYPLDLESYTTSCYVHRINWVSCQPRMLFDIIIKTTFLTNNIKYKMLLIIQQFSNELFIEMKRSQRSWSFYLSSDIWRKISSYALPNDELSLYFSFPERYPFDPFRLMIFGYCDNMVIPLKLFHKLTDEVTLRDHWLPATTMGKIITMLQEIGIEEEMKTK